MDQPISLKQLRRKYGLTQVKAANIVSMPLRTYIRYEDDELYGDKLKRQMAVSLLNEAFEINEEKGILSIKDIQEIVSSIFDRDYRGEIECCYLFGSYAKGYAEGKSDVDLCLSTSITGLRFVGLIERLRTSLHKKVDLLRIDDLKGNVELLKEIFKDGVKIYGEPKNRPFLHGTSPSGD